MCTFKSLIIIVLVVVQVGFHCSIWATNIISSLLRFGITSVQIIPIMNDSRGVLKYEVAKGKSVGDFLHLFLINFWKFLYFSIYNSLKNRVVSICGIFKYGFF